MINEVRIDGRIGKDAEVRFTSSGKCVIKFSIASTERKKQGDQWVDGETSWYDVEHWPTDEQETKKFVKGAYLCLRGRLKVDKWEKDGAKHTKVKIGMKEVESWEFVKGNGQPSSPRSQPQQQERSAPSGGESGPSGDEWDDDIPFGPHRC